ncbi:MAG: LPXTG cell wall anchor domain-containing protein [Streptococcus sp.]|nr:LPXTG cell wall anchor domain-containing protein [Streptococcus sp.]
MLDEKIETVGVVPSNETKQEVSKDMPMMEQKHSMMVDKKEMLPNTGEESTTPLTLVGTMLLSILGFLGFKTKKED